MTLMGLWLSPVTCTEAEVCMFTVFWTVAPVTWTSPLEALVDDWLVVPPPLPVAVASPELAVAAPQFRICVRLLMTTWIGAKFWPCTSTETLALVLTVFCATTPSALVAPLAARAAWTPAAVSGAPPLAIPVEPEAAVAEAPLTIDTESLGCTLIGAVGAELPGTVTVALDEVETVFAADSPVVETETLFGAPPVTTGVFTLLGAPFAPAATAHA